jgi:hypothetical protein
MTTVSVSLESKTFCILSFPRRTSPATLASCCNLPNSAWKKRQVRQLCLDAQLSKFVFGFTFKV